MEQPLDIALVPLQWILAVIGLYYAVLSVGGLFRPRNAPVTDPVRSFAVIVAAHNEEKVIGQLVENLQALNYPRHLYDVFVVADNCTDNTARTAAEAGARVYERSNSHERGKGYALEWMFNKLFSMPRQYDAVAVFDADNLVDPDFLRVMNDHLCRGDLIIQGYMGSKNPNDTWVSAAFSIAFWVINRFWLMAKNNMGLSSVLGGTGMCISTSVLRQLGWGATCLTEDLEFTMKALAMGVPTTWAHRAVVYDEKPLTFAQSWRQRRRWAQGHADVACRYLLRLLWQGIRRRDWRTVDGALHLFQPFFIMGTTLSMVIGSIPSLQGMYTPVMRGLWPTMVWTGLTIFQYSLPLLVIVLDRTPIRPYRYLLLYPLFVLSWIPLSFIGFALRNDHRWLHTQHTRTLRYRDLLLSNK